MGLPTLGHWHQYVLAMVVWFVFMTIVGGLLYRMARFINRRYYGDASAATPVAPGDTNES